MEQKTLCQSLLKDDSFWKEKNALLPKYDRQKTDITGLCFSPGRMGYGHLADIVQDVLDQGAPAGLIAGVETFSMDNFVSLASSDWLSTQMIYGDEKDAVTPKIQGAMSTVLFINNNDKTLAWNRFLDFARDPKLQYATINAPEGAYGMVYHDGDFAEPVSAAVKGDMEQGTVNSDPAKWTRFALERYKAGLKFALVSCTNFSKNGFFTGATVRTIARAWEEKGIAPKGFVKYLLDPKQFSFPNCMIDRIAVSPDDKTFETLRNLGINSSIVVTEETRYWAVEDVFPNGRPAFEKAKGVFMCDSFEEVKQYEDMKLRILNMSHSVIAGLGVLLGYKGNYGIYKAMQDKEIVGIINRIISIVIDTIDSPKKLNSKDFAANAIQRLINPNIPDDPMRIAINASTKMLPRFMETFFEGRKKGISEDRLKVILLPVAGFLRYTLGVDDKGEKYELETDPLKDMFIELQKVVKVGQPASAKNFEKLISDKSVMGENLYSEGTLGKEMEMIAAKMLEGNDSVRKTLKELLK